MNNIKNAINQAQNILLIFHQSHDGDSVGSNLAMYLYLLQIGKNVTLISGDDKIAQNYKTLPGIDQVIEKNIFDIDLNRFDLFITLDINRFDQVSKIKSFVPPKHLKIINIDHHATNVKFGDINYIKKNSPATCQILYDLLHSWQADITPDIAANLIAGIYEDSMFKYQNTTYKTFRIVARLTKICPHFNRYIFDMENSNTPQNIKFMAIALSSIETVFNNQIAISFVPYDIIKNNNFSKNISDNTDINSILKSVIGWNIGINFFEYQPNNIKLGFRTRNPETWDVSLIAKALGGGGHKAASGANLKMSFESAKKLLLDKLKEIYKL